MKSGLCLNMIVKNEIGNLERCLTAAAPYIDCWVIGDTGSTDGTQEFIRTFFASRNIPGEMHSFPFENFSQARNEALDRARRSPLEFDYLLLCDADMELVAEGGLTGGLTHDLYHVVQRTNGLSYWNVRLVRRLSTARYHGVTHEFIGGDGLTATSLPSFSFIDHATGTNRTGKFERDARLLREALEHERDPAMRARYVFYLANSLRDGGDPAGALHQYQARAGMGQWQEEVFVSLWRNAQLMEELGHADTDVIGAYSRASAANPARAEALQDAARFCRQKNLHGLAYDFAKRGLSIPYPANGLFVNDWVYNYGLLDELAVSAYWCGHYRESLKACEKLLSQGFIPAEQRARIEENAQFARNQLPPPGKEPSNNGAGEAADVLAGLLEAFDRHPHRPRPLLELARHFRDRRLHAVGMLFAAEGLAKFSPSTSGTLAAGDHSCLEHLKSEYAVLANFAADPAVKSRGFAICDQQALDRATEPDLRRLARHNLMFYAEPLSALAPSLAFHAPAFKPPVGCSAYNPSIAQHEGGLLLLVRSANYRIVDGQYVPSDGGTIIRTRNFLLRLDEGLNTISESEVLPPRDLPQPLFSDVQGFEDVRLIPRADGLWASATVRSLDSRGLAQMVLSRINPDGEDSYVLSDWRVMSTGAGRRHEKNWTPILDGGPLRFIYGYDPAVITEGDGSILSGETPSLALDHFRGGSQAVPFRGGFLSVIHETIHQRGGRCYLHRFVETGTNGVARSLSRPFYFRQKGIEFAAGLAFHPDGQRIIISFGIRDAEAWLATMDITEIERLLMPIASFRV